jgi:hypothetical protein
MAIKPNQKRRKYNKTPSKRLIFHEQCIFLCDPVSQCDGVSCSVRLSFCNAVDLVEAITPDPLPNCILNSMLCFMSDQCKGW